MEVNEKQPIIHRCPVSAVFNSLDLLGNILQEVTDDIRNNMDLRLVNKSFRDACHANLRKNHRNIKIEFDCIWSEDPDIEMMRQNRVFINYRRFSVLNAYSYLIFLKNNAGVKIQSIVVQDLWALRPSLRVFLHESIRLSLIKTNGDNLSKLIGMDAICHGNCEACLWIPNGCVEYGPLRIESLRKSFNKSHVLEKLIVADYLFDDIANSCVESCTSKNDCFKAMDDLITPKISCKILIVKISENRKESNGPGSHDHQAMPQEVIEVMLKQWKVQSLVLEFVYETHWKDYKGEWTRKEWFTKLCFSDSRDNLRTSSMKFKEVTVDLTTSSLFSIHLRLPKMYNTPNRSYKDIVANIRRVFRNDKLKIQFSSSRTMHSRIDHVVQGVIQNIIDGDPWDFEIEITMYLKYRNDKLYFDVLSNQYPQLRLAVFHGFQIFLRRNTSSEWLQTMDHQYNTSLLFMKNEWNKNCCQFVNEERNLTINWTYFVNEQSPNRTRIFTWNQQPLDHVL